MGANTTSREDQKDNTAAAECKSSLIMHANNYCEFTRERENVLRDNCNPCFRDSIQKWGA